MNFVFGSTSNVSVAAYERYHLWTVSILNVSHCEASVSYVVFVLTMKQVAASAVGAGLDDAFSSRHLDLTRCRVEQVGCRIHVGSLSSLFSGGFWCCLARW